MRCVAFADSVIYARLGEKKCDSAIYVESFCVFSSVILLFWRGIVLYFIAMRGIALMSSLREVMKSSRGNL